MMIWEGIEMIPVVDDYQRLQGIISRQDILKALQMTQRQPQVGETIDDIITTRLDSTSLKNQDGESYYFEVSPQMTNPLGTISYGVFTTLLYEATSRKLRQQKKEDIIIENMTVYFIKPVQIESTIEIIPKVLEVGRKFGKVDVEVYHEGILVGKALLTCQLIDR